MPPRLRAKRNKLLIVGGILGLLVVSTILSMELSLETGRVLVPTVIGAPSRVALERLEKEGLRGKIIGDRYHSSLPKGSVILQNPPPGARIKPERKVSLIVSRGSAELFLPDFSSLSKGAARKGMGAKGLDQGAVVEMHHPRVPSGHIIAQSPPPGTKVRLGDSVSLLVSAGAVEPVYLMPDLVGRDGESTAKALTRMGFKVQLDFPPLPRKWFPRIRAQEPPAGSPVVPGSTILLKMGLEGP